MRSKHMRSKHMRSKLLTSKGWHNEAPGTHERTVMQKECGSKCFLGPISESCFPICTKNTCKVNEKGVYAAYVRAREYGSPKFKKNKTNKRSSKQRSSKQRSSKQRSSKQRSSKQRSSKQRSSKLYGHNHTKKLYRKIASRAKTMLKKRGYGPNLK